MDKKDYQDKMMQVLDKVQHFTTWPYSESGEQKCQHFEKPPKWRSLGWEALRLPDPPILLPSHPSRCCRAVLALRRGGRPASCRQWWQLCPSLLMWRKQEEWRSPALFHMHAVHKLASVKWGHLWISRYDSAHGLQARTSRNTLCCHNPPKTTCS